VRHGLAVLRRYRDDVLAEVAARVWVRGVGLSKLDQEAGLEDVDAHRGQRQVRLARNAGGSAGFSTKL
jgi:hypothetical protein